MKRFYSTKNSNEDLVKEITNLKNSIVFFHKLIKSFTTSLKRRSKYDKSLRKFFVINKQISKKNNDIKKDLNYNSFLIKLKKENPILYNKIMKKQE